MQSTSTSIAPLEYSQPNTRLAIVAWGVMLLCSLLPDILIIEGFHGNTDWVMPARFALLGAALAVALALKWLRPLWGFFVMLIAIMLTEQGMGWVSALPFWSRLFGQPDGPFAESMLHTQVTRLGVSLLMIGVMLALGWTRSRFFLTRGDIRAPAEPVRWLGIHASQPWTVLGRNFGLAITGGTLLFLFLAARPSGTVLLQSLALLPAVLLFAMLNAFNEELTYRSSLLGALQPVLGRQSIWIAAVFFGIGHFYGVPYGIIGVLMATFLGWLLGKAMLETKGFFWSWFIHFLQDVAIFWFMAAGSITPGG